MTTQIGCPCGARYRVTKVDAGKLFKCRICARRLRVPTSSQKSKRFRITCICGQILTGPRELAGKLITCPDCGASHLAPYRPEIAPRGTRQSVELPGAFRRAAASAPSHASGRGKYSKTAPGEALCYRPANISGYAGQPFCLRITLNGFGLDKCFFSYHDSSLEELSIENLFQRYFESPKPARIQEMKTGLARWIAIDPHILKKYQLLRQLFEQVHENGGTVTFHINHGPANFALTDRVAAHLGTSVWSNDEHNEKILDIVLEPKPGGKFLANVARWEHLPGIDEATSAAAGFAESTSRRQLAEISVWVVVATWFGYGLLYPFYSDKTSEHVGGSSGSGFFGGGL